MGTVSFLSKSEMYLHCACEGKKKKGVHACHMFLLTTAHNKSNSTCKSSSTEQGSWSNRSLVASLAFLQEEKKNSFN